MKLRFTISICILLLVTKINAQSVLTIGTSTVICDTILTGLDVPWEILYGPDNHIWMTERKGIVSRVDPVAKTKTTLLDLSSVLFYNAESGLLGMALHPDFAITPEVFLVYTYGSNAAPKEKLVKYTYYNGILQNEVILIDSIIANSFHDGARLMFMPDKTLLMTTGEAGNTSLSQNMNSLNGKVLRVNMDGTVPSDNPFPGSYIYTSGHRNPQGLVMGPNGIIYISEHGPSNDDEFQILEKGRNYGWPNVEGFCNLPAEITYCNTNNIKEPLMGWSPTLAVNDLVYYINPNFPEFHERFLMTTLKEKKIVAIKLNAAGTSSVSENSYLANMFGRLRDICVGSSSEIYLATNGPDAFNNQPNTHSLLVLRPKVYIISVNKNTALNQIQVYPSPANETITIDLKDHKNGNFTLKIQDICGKLYGQESFDTKKHIYSVTGLENGLYFLTLTEGSKILHQGKIVVAK